MQAIVVDDSKAMRMILSKFLRDLGFEVFQASDGVDAIEQLEARHNPIAPDLALVDWNMPEMDGLEFVETVRRNRHFDGIKIMMVTTESSMDRMQSALEAGADEYVMKPFTQEVIADKVRMLGLELP